MRGPDKRRESQRRYDDSAKGRTRHDRYEKSEHGKTMRERYHADGKRTANARRIWISGVQGCRQDSGSRKGDRETPAAGELPNSSRNVVLSSA